MNRIFYLLSLVIPIAGCSNANENANKLYIEASRLFKSADYEQALQKLGTIIEEYPESDIAVKLVQGEARIGGYTLEAFKAQGAAIDIKQIGLALDMYAADNREYPTTEQGFASSNEETQFVQH